MANTPKDKQEKKDKKNPGLAPDPETLHTTDPQEHMKGPFHLLCKTLRKKRTKTIRFQKKRQIRKEKKICSALMSPPSIKTLYFAAKAPNNVETNRCC